MPQIQTVFCDSCKCILDNSELVTFELREYETNTPSGNQPATFRYMEFRCPRCGTISSSSIAMRDESAAA